MHEPRTLALRVMTTSKGPVKLSIQTNNVPRTPRPPTQVLDLVLALKIFAVCYLTLTRMLDCASCPLSITCASFLPMHHQAEKSYSETTTISQDDNPLREEREG